MINKTHVAREFVRETERSNESTGEGTHTRIFHMQSSDADDSHVHMLHYIHSFDAVLTAGINELITGALGKELPGTPNEKRWDAIPGVENTGGILSISLLQGTITINFTDHTAQGSQCIELLKALISKIDGQLQTS